MIVVENTTFSISKPPKEEDYIKLNYTQTKCLLSKQRIIK